MASTGLWSFDYEIYGDVQGVFFRKYTEDQAKHVAVVGWVKNTPHGTVTGQVQGSKEKVEKMDHRECSQELLIKQEHWSEKCLSFYLF
ncbi:acylphosphatase-2-like isoform X4 [Engystomops pustulosus]|uniref:acylphosphatase-2-like isoform X4 n=1 Tax=Engystomops pustulosus TaxID=76066 RepID=UPI003AFB3ECD